MREVAVPYPRSSAGAKEKAEGKRAAIQDRDAGSSWRFLIRGIRVKESVVAAHSSSTIEDPASFRDALAPWFAENGRDLPWRRRTDAYAVMVSEFMLQQTQVATVIPYFQRWLARFPDFPALAAASEDAVLHAWQGLGYYSRAKNLHRAAKHVVEHHGGKLPRDAAAIRALPGVGRYTAGAIASFAFDLPAELVDANVARVLARVLDLREPIDSTAGAETLWATARALVPESGARLHNSALMELGALVCSPRNPQCLVCPVRSHCRATAPESLPVKKPRRATVAMEEDCAWIVHHGRVLLEQQNGRRWTGLWKLPALTARPSQAVLVHTLQYPFTHHRVSLAVFEQRAPKSLTPGQRWFPVGELGTIAMTSPHRRAAAALLARSKKSPSRRTKTGDPGVTTNEAP